MRAQPPTPFLRNALPALLAAAGLAMAAFGASAQTPPPPASEVLRFEGEAEPVAIPQFDAGPCKIAPLTRETVGAGALKIDRIEVDGVRNFDGRGLHAEWSPLAGRSVDVASVNRALERVECRYAERGFVAVRAWLEPTTTPGVWRLSVREGLVSDIEIRGVEDPEAEAFLRRAFGGVRTGKPLRLGDLRRGLDAAARFGFWTIRPSGRMSSGKQASMVLALDADEAPPGVFVNGQNASAESVGRWSIGVGAGFNGLTGAYERNLIGVFHDLTGDAQRGAQISSRVLINESGLELAGDLAVFEQQPDEPAPFADTRGRTQLARVELRHPLGARGDLLASGRIGFESVDQDTDLIAGAPTVRDSLRTVYAAVMVERRRADRSVSGEIMIRRGIAGLGASEAGDPLLSRPQAEPEATVLRAGANASFPLGDWRVDVRARAQWTGEPVLAFEEFTFGGLVGGRSLDPGAISGDRGASVTLEMVGPPLVLGGPIVLRPFVSAEAAGVWNEDAFGPDRASGVFAAAGVRATVHGRWTVDVAYATPVGDVTDVPDYQAKGRVQVAVSGGWSF